MSSKLASSLIILLTVVCVYQTSIIVRFDASTSPGGGFLEDEELTQCINHATRSAVNKIDEAVARPRILDDLDEISRYVSAFEPELYQVSDVQGVGSFYIDEQKDSIKDIIRQGKVWEPRVVRMLMSHVRPGTTVIDAGAHIGTHSLVMAAHTGPHGRVYSFEPQRKIYRELVNNMKLNSADNVVPLRFALGDESGVIEMNPTEVGNEGGTHVGSGGDKAELRTIDSFGFKNVSLIKIDVEHMEDLVLEGATQTIMESRPVLLIEIQGGYNYDSAPLEIREKIETTLKKVSQLGYTTSRFGVYDFLAMPQ